MVPLLSLSTYRFGQIRSPGYLQFVKSTIADSFIFQNGFSGRYEEAGSVLPLKITQMEQKLEF